MECDRTNNYNYIEWIGTKDFKKNVKNTIFDIKVKKFDSFKIYTLSS